MGAGRRRADEKASRNASNRPHAGGFKTPLVTRPHTAHPDPNVHPDTRQPTPAPARAPAPGRAPQAPAFRRARERRGAGPSRRLDSLLPRRPQHAVPAPLAGQGRVPAAGRGPRR